MAHREVERFVLVGRRMSGRGVRLLPLLPGELDAVARDAARMSGSNDLVELRAMQFKIGVARCLKGITKGPVPLVEQPVLEHGKPKMRPALDEKGKPKHDAHGKAEMEPVTEPVPDQVWLADEKNWIKPDPMAVEMNFDEFVPNAKDDSWLTAWWQDTHEISSADVQRIMEKVQRVSSG
jgi:hypothetical protein